jgi:hypothetical protein
MPIHDWTRMDAGTFHAFHTLWIGELMKALNAGLLPKGYYALAEQIATRMQTDLLTLRAPPPDASRINTSDGLAVAEAPPPVGLSVRPDPRGKSRRTNRRGRHLVVRHISGHQVVALVEIVSPSDKDRKAHVRELAEKIVRRLEAGIHVLLIDVLPATWHDPDGLHGAVWSWFDTASYEPSADRPLTLVAYAWDGEEPQAFLEAVAVGRPLIDMPLFLTPQRYVSVPLEATDRAAYAGMPEYWRHVIEQDSSPRLAFGVRPLRSRLGNHSGGAERRQFARCAARRRGPVSVSSSFKDLVT